MTPQAPAKGGGATRRVSLAAHSSSGAGPACAIDVRLAGEGGGTAALTYSVSGRIDRLRVPVPRTPAFADGLWQRTCFEAFIARKGDPRYVEFNFSPSGEWAFYAFDRYRERAAEPRDVAALGPAITVRRETSLLELDAVLRLDRIPVEPPLRIGLTAVIEDVDGALSYWALRHPPGKPDFHDPDTFVLELE